jgi:predicted DNA binding CopG/RHH family protein
MKQKTLQTFSDEYLEYCRRLSPDQIITFLDQFRRVAFVGQKTKSKLISMKVAIPLLESFRFKAESLGKCYQTVIKELMSDWLLNNNKP